MNIHFITEKIHKALAAAGLMRAEARRASGRNSNSNSNSASDGNDDLVVVERVDVPQRPSADRPADRPAERPANGRFIALSHRGPRGARDYKLYVPAAYIDQPMPLLLMLHGCKQNPDDFAAGTRMNELAEQHGFLVAYPAQSVAANGSNCWNWFERTQQARDGAEPAILAGIVADVAEAYAVKADQVFVAGLSAGAAMAVILGRAFPEVFAAVAAHSGLPVGAAHDVVSAFAAMAGRVPFGAAGDTAPVETSPTPRTIVFHGDADATVKASNGAAIVAQAVASFEAGAGPLRQHTHADSARGTRIAQVAKWADESGAAVVEEWRVAGGGHAWFGGSAAGSYTDAAGPDASAEIVRFFLHP